MKKCVLIEKFREKKCSKCNNIYPATNEYFNIQKNGKYKLSSNCKFCRRKDHFNNKEHYNKLSKLFYEKNKEICKKNSQKHRKKNKNYYVNYNKEYYKNNKEEIIKSKKEYYKINKCKKQKYNKKYFIENKEIILIQKNNFTKEKKKNNVFFKLKLNISSLIREAIKRKGYTKKSRTHEILGCTYEEFKNHIEKQFLPWMNWENYGKYNGEPNFGWDFDHIIPISSSINEGDVIRLNHYTNFQPLCSKINRDIKRERVDFKLEFLTK